METLKKNLLSILCGVGALVAVILCFWPLGSWKSEAQARLDERTKVQASVQGVMTKSRKLPMVSLGGGAERKLEMFPTEKAIGWAKDLKAKLAQEALQVRQAASRMNARQILVEGSLPEPQAMKDYEFRDRYLALMSTFPKEMKFGPPPSDEEVERALDELWVTKFQPRIAAPNGVVDRLSEEEQRAAFNKESKSVPERVKQARARTLLLYASRSAIAPDADIGEASSGTAPGASAIWNAQMHLWLQWDIATAIIETNREMSKMTPKCVIDAPVKYLRRLEIGGYRADAKPAAGPGSMGGPGGGPMGGPMGGMGGPMGRPTGGMGPPPGVGAPPELLARLKESMAAGAEEAQAEGSGGSSPMGRSFTGRRSNAQYDVIPFRMVVDVEVDYLPYFLTQLGRNRFITPYEVDIEAVDAVVLGAQENVVYGSAPIVRATILCEALMFRDWTASLMPEEIRGRLGINVAGAGSAPAAGAAKAAKPKK